MKKLLFLLFFTPLLVVAKTVKPKIMHAQNRNDYHRHYSHSSTHRSTEDEILSSSAEATGQITINISLQISTDAVSQATSEESQHDTARLSYLDNNRIEITEDIAKGEGEHLETLLSMMNLSHDEMTLKRIQKNFDELIYLNPNDFLDKLERLT